jgi:hypothetical protein
MTDKQQRYLDLVNERKACARCPDLVNPSQCAGGVYDSNAIGPWSR